MAAARCEDDKWDYKGHGLRVVEDRGGLALTVIHPQPGRDGGDAFSVVSRAVGSPPLTEACDLGRLWASIPDMDPVEEIVGDHPRALWLQPEGAQVGLTAQIEIPEIHLARDEWVPAVALRMAEYPHAGRIDIRGPLHDHTGRPLGFSVAFASDEREGIFRLVSDVGEPLWEEDNRYLRPAVNAAGDLPTTFMSLWALLLALSVYARYVPGAWSTVLARDTSTIAIPLESTLRAARRGLPRLVLHAITGKWA